MTEHTSGPWTAHRTGHDLVGWSISAPKDGASTRIAEVMGSSKVTEANARLIAAAPDLLEALKEIRDALDVPGILNTRWLERFASEAIRKATE